MPSDKVRSGIIDQLSSSIADDVGNMHDDDLEVISKSFDDTLDAAMKAFNSSLFDEDGYIRKMRTLDTGEDDSEVVKHVLNGIQRDYMGVESINHTELLLRRDLYNITKQMPEMRDVISVVRDAIVECNVATGEVSRTLTFRNHEDNEGLMAQVHSIEERHDLLMAIKNFIIPNALRTGEMYVQVTSYAKLFAEMEAIRNAKYSHAKQSPLSQSFHESCPHGLIESLKPKTTSLMNKENLTCLMESVSKDLIADTTAADNIERGQDQSVRVPAKSQAVEKDLTSLLEHIEVCGGSSSLMSEYGPEAFVEFVCSEYARDQYMRKDPDHYDPAWHFMESMNMNTTMSNGFNLIDQDDIKIDDYKEVKGCYVKYLDPLRLVPIRMDRRIIGYYYISTSMDLQLNPAQPNGIVDLSFQNYVRDRNLVGRLANLIIRSFDKKMLERNIRLKDEIAEIIMAHKFSEGKLSFIYIPENEVIRFAVNEDENGHGHSIIEPTMFPARSYLMLTMYNMIYTLNNNTTRVHYLRSSGLNKNYAAQVQRTMRKFQGRRISADDIFSYTNVLNKIGGMGEMVLPSGRGDFKALETDTIEAVNTPINMEFLEQQRRQAISGTGVPHLMMINAIDEADFAKTLEMANTRFLSTVSSYKIDFNKGITRMYQMIMRYEADLEPDTIQSFSFQFNPAKQQEMTITADMVNNFNQIYEAVCLAYYSKAELEDSDGNPSPVQKHLRKELAKIYLSQLDFEALDKIVDRVNLLAKEDVLQQQRDQLSIGTDDLKEVEST